MTDILFSHSYYYKLDPKQWNTGMPYPPLGTLYAASFMRENGFNCNLFDVCLKDGPDEIEKIIVDTTPKYLVLYDDGFNYLTKMCLTNMREAAFKMIKIGKKHGCKVVVSSSDSTDHYQLYLNEGADAVLLGEGEVTLLELIQKWNKKENITAVKGLCYKEEGIVHSTGRRPVINNLDMLPTAAWDLIDISSYKSKWAEHGNKFALNLGTTRGCPYKCNWCAKPIYGNRYNSRSPEKVVAEIVEIKSRFDVTNYWMCDDIFGLKPGWVQSFKNELDKANVSITYKIQSRADLLLKEDNIDALVSSGLKEVWIGAESGSQRILDAMDKGTTLQQIEDATKLLQSKGVLVAFFIQYGYLSETKEEINQTIEMIKRLDPDNIGVSVSYPLPGTKFYDVVKDQLSEKQNWTDSNDLAMMFKGTFNQEYYTILHSYTHKVFHQKKGFNQLKAIFTKPHKMNRTSLKSIVRLPYYAFKTFQQGRSLSKMENTNLG